MKKIFKFISDVLVDVAKTIAIIIMMMIITVRFICDCTIIILGSFIRAIKLDKQISDTLAELFKDYLSTIEGQIIF